MKYRGQGRYFNIDPKKPEAIGICDSSGFVFKRKDMVKEMQWRGNSLEWTGFYVGKPYLDKPNEQLRPSILPPDPIPVKDPRGYQETRLVWSTIGGVTWGNLKVQNWASWGGTFNGSIALPPDEQLQQLQQAYFGA